MNNKGFTLLELLGVMIILMALMAFALPNLINLIKSTNDDTDNITESLIYNATEMLIKENKSDFPRVEGNVYCITLYELINEGYLKSSIIEENNINSKSVQVIYMDDFDYKLKNNMDCTD